MIAYGLEKRVIVGSIVVECEMRPQVGGRCNFGLCGM